MKSKDFIFFSLFIAIALSCGIKAQTNDRKEIINNFFSATMVYDTNQIFSIVDTAHYFEVYAKEGLLNDIEFLRSRLEECGREVIDSTIQVKRRDIPFTDYLYHFCRDKKGDTLQTSFDIQFTFADFANTDKIYSINIKRYFFDLTPTKPLPIPQ